LLNVAIVILVPFTVATDKVAELHKGISIVCTAPKLKFARQRPSPVALFYCLSTMDPPSLHIVNQLKLASQLQVHRLHQDLANAQKKLVEYEELSKYSAFILSIQPAYGGVFSCIIVYRTLRHSNECLQEM